MTISVVQAVKATGTSTSSLSLTLSSTTSGNTIVVFFSGGTTTGAAITGITVALGATGDVFHPLGLSSVFVSTGPDTLATTAAFADYNCTGSQTAVTISYTTSGTVGVAAYAYEVSGLGSTPVLDQNSMRSAVSDSASALFVDNVYTTGPVQTTANNTILLAAVNAAYGSGTPTLTGPGGGWTSETGQSYTTSEDAYMISGYQVVSSTGTYVYTPTATTAIATDGMIVALAASTTHANPYIVQYCNLTNYTADSYSAVMPKDFTAGNLVVVSEMAYAYTGTPPTMSIPTLTPSSDALSAAVGPTTPSGTHPTAGIYYYQNVPASQTGIAASVTGSTAVDTIMQASIYEYGNMPTTGSAVDQTATATGASTAPSSGSTGTTTELIEVIIGQIAYTNSTTSITLTPPASPWSWCEVDDFDVSLTQIGVQIPATQISSSETTFSISGTISSSEDWAAQVATFFTNAGAGTPQNVTGVPGQVTITVVGQPGSLVTDYAGLGADGTSTWVNPAHAEGAPDGSYATWTAT